MAPPDVMTTRPRRPKREPRGIGIGTTFLFVVLLVGVAVLAVALM